MFSNVDNENEYQDKKQNEKEEKFELNSLSLYTKPKKFKNKFEDDYFENPNKEEEEQKEVENQKKFRTELCKYYEINGRCKFGENRFF